MYNVGMYMYFYIQLPAQSSTHTPLFSPGLLVGGLAGLVGGHHVNGGAGVVVRGPEPSSHVVHLAASLHGLLLGQLQLLGPPLHLITSFLLLGLGRGMEGGTGKRGRGEEGKRGRGDGWNGTSNLQRTTQ